MSSWYPDSISATDEESENSNNTIGPRGHHQRAASALPANQFTKIHGYDGGPRVTVVVGPEEQVYSIPKKLLCSQSEYFRAMFESTYFTEGKEQKCCLYEVDPDTFELLLQWITTDSFTLPLSPEEAKRMEGLPEAHSGWDTGAQLAGNSWILPGKEDAEPEKLAQVTSAEVGYAAVPDFVSKMRHRALEVFRQLFEVLILADYLKLAKSPVGFVRKMMNDMSSWDGMEMIDLLDSDIIERAWQLADANPIRKLLTEACTEHYIDCYMPSLQVDLSEDGIFSQRSTGTVEAGRPPFRFTQQLQEIPGFAAQLMEMVTKTLLSLKISIKPSLRDRDPQHWAEVDCPMNNKSKSWLPGVSRNSKVQCRRGGPAYIGTLSWGNTAWD